MGRGTPVSGTVGATLQSAATNAVILVARYSGADLTNPVGNVLSGNDLGLSGACSGGVDTGSFTFDLTTTSGNAVFGAVAARSRTLTPGAGYAKRGDIFQGVDSGSMAGVSIMDRTASAATTPVDGTVGSPTDWAVVALEVRPAAAAAAALALGGSGEGAGDAAGSQVRHRPPPVPSASTRTRPRRAPGSSARCRRRGSSRPPSTTCGGSASGPSSPSGRMQAPRAPTGTAEAIEACLSVRVSTSSGLASGASSAHTIWSYCDEIGGSHPPRGGSHPTPARPPDESAACAAVILSALGPAIRIFILFPCARTITDAILMRHRSAVRLPLVTPAKQSLPRAEP